MSNKGFETTRSQAIKIALDGIKYVLKTQPNARIHLVFTLAVFLLAGVLKLSDLEWVVLFLTVGLVWAAEIFNTAIETAVDVISPDYHPKAKMIKDISAGGVLACVLVAILVGLVLFGPPLWEWIKTLI